MKKMLILRTGSTALEVRRIHGDYDRWFTDALAGFSGGFEIVDVTREPIPDVTAYSGVIVTGATSTAYKPEPWMDPVVKLLRSIETTGVPALCVCLGAQLLAQCRGGRVVLNPRGWEIGAVDVDLTDSAREDPLFEGLPPRVRVLATHEDLVEELPPGGVLLASNDNSPVQAFRVGDRAWGLQFHPEISAAALEILIRLRGDVIEKDLASRGQDSAGLRERLIAVLRRSANGHGRRVMENFARVCGQDKEKPLGSEAQRL